MSSLKMTFSLTSLILIFAFVAAMPVLAHIDTEETGHEATDAATHAPHAVVESVSAPEWTNGDEFEVTITFADADEANEVILPTAALASTSDITVGGGGTVTYPDLVPGTSLKTQTLTVTGTTADAAIEVVTAYAFTATAPTGTPTPPDPLRPTVMFDGAGSTFTVAVDTKADFTLASGKTDTLQGAFTVLVTAYDDPDLTDTAVAGSGVKSVMLSVMPAGKATLDPADGMLALGNPYFSATRPTDFSGEYRAVVTPAVDYTGDLTFTVMIEDVAGNTVQSGAATTSFVKVKVEKTADAPPSTTPDPSPGLGEDDTRRDVTEEATFDLSGTLASNSFVIVAPMARDDIPGTEIVIADLPDIHRFFARGGTISLVGGASKSVVISEIMWGLNLAAEPAMQADKQWIELLNPDNDLTDTDATNAAAAPIDLSGYKLVFTPGTVLPKPAMLADQISNIERAGWDVNIGQSGKLGAATQTFTPVDMISMYRDINFENLTKKHGDKNAADNKTEQLKAIPGGNAASGWAPSTVNDTYATNQLGSPGAQHFVGRKVFGEQSVGRNAVVITEVGNNSNDAYDWVELTAVADTGLKDYELQHIDGDKKITVLAHFHDKVLKAGEILLVVQSNPRNNPDHPIAAGKEWKLADVDRDNTGTASLYHVHGNLKIPNDKGKGLFVLRNAKGKNDWNNIVDIAGNSFVTDNSSDYRTNFWPLRATAAGHGNVIDGDVEDFNQGRVYQRNARNGGAGNVGDGGAHEKDWSIRGYTGIGYKRSAANNGQNGGTPGFDNGAVKEKSSDLANAAVSISEIMYDRGDRKNLPQWIELHNSSATQAANLNEWKLKIENADDVDIRTPAVTIANLGGTIIPPNQTILIVAYTTGRVSRGSQGGIDFPATRVISVSGKGELEIPADVNKRNYRLLSKTAFKLTLMEKGGGMVDTVGNMGAATAWELPMAENGEGRSSIIRRYDAGMKLDGTMESSWVLAATSDLAEVRVNETYYGHPDDSGTPGYRGGGALPVSLSKFRPERLKESGEIVVRWITESELNNAGFNILRSEKRDSGFTKVHFEAGKGTTSERQVYEWKDTTANKPNVIYYYQIQDVSLDGEVTTLRTTHLRGNVTAVGKATTTWGEIKALQ